MDLLLPSDESWTAGANVVDLGDGGFNVFASFAVIARADLGFGRCMALALKALDDDDLSV